ncbi:MAG: succinate dehydrogenase [Deltaproteobacteria bacterium]|nr:succinate dehydrogenase [Deltaproteobacteria bacterium]
MAKFTHNDWHFILRRLHSLTGIVPIGGFLLFHFFENASARRGAAAFDKTVEAIGDMPYLYALELGLLAVPILFHAIYGLFITTSSRPNVGGYGYARNWAYFFQRVSGLIAFAYILFHVSTTRIYSLFFKGSAITFADMQAMLSQPIIFAFYILGIIAVVFHFSNGIWSFSVTWGLVRSPEGQKRLAQLTMVIFAILAVVGIDIVSSFIWDQGLLSRAAGALGGF